MMLKAYFDDSGTHHTAPVLSVGGLIGTESQWTAFDGAWKFALLEPLPGKPRIKQWATADCRSGDGEFEGYSQADRDAVTRRFRMIIAESGVVSLNSVIDVQAWTELVVNGGRTKMGSAEEFCVVSCVLNTLAYAYANPDGRQVAIYYDAGRQRKSGKLDKIRDIFLRRAFENTKVVSFTFGKVVDYTPLQGADLVATESYWLAQDWLKAGAAAQPRPHFKDFIERVNGAGYILDRAAIEGELKNRNPDGSLKPGVSPLLWQRS
jgi:hypothetical protein